MRPLRLTMTAFGPYAGTEVVDFDALTDLGLFVVAGNNGSGKTTIFDALHYALYGMLPGRRATYLRLKSDHASDRTECCVTLDFAAHGKHWRVERSPKQKRAKRRGNGTTEAPAAATLFQLDQGIPTAITNRVEEVRAKCAELVGLSGKQFERVALLPQGQFSRVLTESSTERRELLRTLFSSEIFDDATTLLTEAAAQATAADRAVLERLDHRHASLADELASLTGCTVASPSGALQPAIMDYRRRELAGQITAVADLETTAKSATRDHQAGVDIAQRLERRRQVRAELAIHAQADPQNRADVVRLNNARSAVPVTSNARSLSQHQQHRHQARQRVDELHHQLNQALNTAGLGEIVAVDKTSLTSATSRVADLDARLAAHRDAALRVQDMTAIVARSHTELRRMANEIRTLDEHGELASTQLRQAKAELATLQHAADIHECEQNLRTADARLSQRIEFAGLESSHAQLVRRATELDATIAQLDQARDTAVQAQSSHLSVQHKADTAYAQYEECERRRQVADRYHGAMAKLQTVRAEFAKAQTHTDQLWDGFIAGTAARVAQALTDDEPCPVCGSCEHPAPAVPTPGDQIVTEPQVAAARSHSDSMQAQVRAVESQIETLRAVDEDIASLSVTELAAQVTTTKAMALGARTIADETRRAASVYEQVDHELTGARVDRAALGDELRTVDQCRSRLEGALGPVANEPVATLRAQAADAAAARAQADQLVERRDQLAAVIDKADRDIETIGLGQIAAESRRASTREQLAERQQNLDTASANCDEAQRALTTNTRAASAADHDLELRTQATRHARGLIADALTALALEHDAIDAVRRAQSILDERLQQSPFTALEQATAAFVEPPMIAQLEARTTAHAATGERLQGQLHELANLPDSPPDVVRLRELAEQAARAFATANTSLITVTASLDRIESELASIESERKRCQTTDLDTRRLERVAALAKGDNDRNTSLENWVLAAHLRDVVELANIRLARSTHQRFQLCVMDDGENKRGKWGLDLGVEDTVTGTRRPTPGLSGGELFQASLALALGLADAVMNQSAGVSVDALFIDEGFGSLDETSVERAIDLLDELRDRGAMVGVITHVPALLHALPLGVTVIEAEDGQGSTIRQSQHAA